MTNFVRLRYLKESTGLLYALVARSLAVIDEKMTKKLSKNYSIFKALIALSPSCFS